MTTAILDVNGARYGLDYHGHDQPLHAWTDEHELRLSPWLLGQHLAALGQTTRVDDGALGLDAGAYAAQVLGPALQQVDAVARWGPLALWWAAGAEPEAPPATYMLRPWTMLERASAVRAALDPETGAFQVGRYLGMLVACCVQRVSGPDPLALPMARGGPLLAAVCRLCAPEPLLPPVVADPALRRLTLRICAALGWSPARVWQTPAGELDQLLALLDDTPVTRPRPRLSTLADHRDTHTIEIDD